MASTHNNISIEFEHLPPATSQPADPGAKIAIVTLQRPEKLNGLTLDMLTELRDTARRLAHDRQLRGVILRGAGRSFCAGLDFGATFSTPQRVAAGFIPDRTGANLFQAACWQWRRLPVPVIAIVHGHCYGGGLQLALGADFRITTPEAQWSILEAKWGLIPDMSGMRTIVDEIPAATAKWLTMSADIFDADTAVETGLATWAAPDTEAALAQAEQRLAQLATRSPDQIAATKHLFRDINASPRTTFRRERVQQLLLLAKKNTSLIRAAAMKQTEARFVLRGTWLSRARNLKSGH